MKYLVKYDSTIICGTSAAIGIFFGLLYGFSFFFIAVTAYIVWRVKGGYTNE